MSELKFHLGVNLAVWRIQLNTVIVTFTHPLSGVFAWIVAEDGLACAIGSYTVILGHVLNRHFSLGTRSVTLNLTSVISVLYFRIQGYLEEKEKLAHL
jgi:hypothetical protein